jgi:hypothetical protein
MKFFPRFFSSRRPPSAASAVGMIVAGESDWFRTYAANTYSGAGAIVDLGCFVGSTTISLAQGLRVNRASETAKIHACDCFIWEDWMQRWWEEKGLAPPELEAGSFLPEFLKRTSPWKDQIIVHRADLAVSRWDDGPIEFLLVDVMKSADVAEAITRNYFSFLIPGVSYLAHQDFAHWLTSWISVLQFRLRDSFALAADIPNSGTVVFHYRKPFSPEAVGDLSMTSVTPEEIEAAFDYSLDLVSDSKKPNVVASKAMAYLHRGDVDRAREVLRANRWGPTSYGQDLEIVEKLIRERGGNS